MDCYWMNTIRDAAVSQRIERGIALLTKFCHKRDMTFRDCEDVLLPAPLLQVSALQSALPAGGHQRAPGRGGQPPAVGGGEPPPPRHLALLPCLEPAALSSVLAATPAVAWCRAPHRLASACDVYRQTPQSCPVPETLARNSAGEHDVRAPPPEPPEHRDRLLLTLLLGVGLGFGKP